MSKTHTMKNYIAIMLLLTCILINFTVISSKSLLIEDNEIRPDPNLVYMGRRDYLPSSVYSVQCSWKNPGIPYTIQWTKNGRDLMEELSSGEIRLYTLLSPMISFLEFTSLKKKHEGIYKCMPEYDASFNLTIDNDRVDGSEVRYSGADKVFPGEDVTIQCEILKPSNFSIIWTRQNEPILDLESNVKIETNNSNNHSKITITGVRYSQAGDYRCINGKNSFKLTVTKITHTYIGPKYIEEGDHWEIRCFRKFVDGTTGIWYKNDILLDDELRTGDMGLFTSKTGNVHKLGSISARLSHQGNYSCTKNEPNPHELQITARAQIFYDGLDEFFPEDKDVLANTTIARCSNFQPGDRISWRRNGQPIGELTDGFMQVYTSENGRESALATFYHLPNFSSKLAGNYSCIPGSTKSHSVGVKTEGYIGSKIVLKGTDAFIKCNLKAEMGGYQWIKDEKPVNEVSRFNSTRTPYGSLLKIRQARLEDEGFYKCTRNSDKFFYLEVIE